MIISSSESFSFPPIRLRYELFFLRDFLFNHFHHSRIRLIFPALAEEIGNFYYGSGHPMKPHRIRMAHQLVLNYGLYKKMEVFRPQLITDRQMTVFHTDDYIDFLRKVTPDNQFQYIRELNRFNMDVDCPVFDGVFRYCQTYAGGSVGGAYRLNKRTSDVAINWAGGLHHAKKSEASGFCYVNDIVLAILELLKYHARVLYIDIDIHHGDGVEEAFYTTDRVMTVSFHKYGDYFPGTGGVNDIGVKQGKNYSLNFPLKAGIDDDSFTVIFKSVLTKVMEHYRPGAVVLQCGADSLTGDRLGCFNLTLNGHGACVDFMSSFNVPLLILGGGGYTVRNVARCWANETAIALGQRLPDELPYNEYYEYYGPEFRLHLSPSNMENLNSRKELEDTTMALLEVLSQIEHAPSVQYSTAIPDSLHAELEEDAEAARDNQDTDIRMSAADRDRLIVDDREFFEDDNDQDMMAATAVKTSHPATDPR